MSRRVRLDVSLEEFFLFFFGKKSMFFRNCSAKVLRLHLHLQQTFFNEEALRPHTVSAPYNKAHEIRVGARRLPS
jgi:hypothetical protein